MMDASRWRHSPSTSPSPTAAPGSPERQSLTRRIAELETEEVELTCTIGGKRRLAAGDPFDVVQPHDHARLLDRSAHATAGDAMTAAKEAAHP